jgi:KUP system potassium uptake protein
METPDVGNALEQCGKRGLEVEAMLVTYFLSREKVIPGEAAKTLARWRDMLFAAMARNAGDVTDFFNIPSNRVVELGTRIEI